MPKFQHLLTLHLLPGLDIAIIIDICLWSLGVWEFGEFGTGTPGAPGARQLCV
jgi:hypothetical protein